MSNNTTKQYHYVYRITDKHNSMHYVGSRSCNILPIDDLGNVYYSSSTNKQFIIDQKKDHPRFKYKILYIFNNRKDAIKFESKYHHYFDVRYHPKFLNKANQCVTFYLIHSGDEHFTSKMSIDEKELFYKNNSQKISKTLKEYYNKNEHWSKTHHDASNIYKTASEKQRRTKSDPIINAKIRASIKEGCKNRNTSGNKNPNSKKIIIFDNNDNVVCECNGNFKSKCYELNLPYGAMCKTYINNTILYENKSWQTRAIKSDRGFCIGWYARFH